MVGGRIFDVATGTFGHASMVKLEGFPILSQVTVGAFTGEVVGRFVGQMAGATFGGCAFVLTVNVASKAVCFGMCACEWIEAMVYIAHEGHAFTLYFSWSGWLWVRFGDTLVCLLFG